MPIAIADMSSVKSINNVKCDEQLNQLRFCASYSVLVKGKC